MKILCCLNNNHPVLSPDRALWSQMFWPSSGRVVAPIGGFRGTAAFLPTIRSSVSSIQVWLCPVLWCLVWTQKHHFLLCSIMFNYVSVNQWILLHSSVMFLPAPKKASQSESVCLHRPESRAQERKEGCVGVRKKLKWERAWRGELCPFVLVSKLEMNE